jgi:undecaprenyl-diphosphatase|tara:strand:- start:4751 stop:5551 length:801 start_codon:yes stop_codon:yes gene_type:complete
MDITQGLILGVVQGITEFLPISSSGHLILARETLGIQTEFGLAFDAVLHFATALAVLVYFRRDLIRLIQTAFSWCRRVPVEPKDKVLLMALALGTAPAVVLGILLESTMETAFRNPVLVAVTLLVGAGIMFFAERAAKQTGSLTAKKGLWIGFLQSLALVPGMSRAGMAISGGLLFGLTREEAARFAFLLALPILLGAGGKKLLELGSANAVGDMGLSLLGSAIAAFVVGIVSMHYLIKYLKNHTLNIFVWYRVALALLVLALIYT